MRHAREIVRETTAGVHIVDDPAILSASLDLACAAVIWHRQMPPSVQTWLDSLAPNVLPSGQGVIRPNAVADMIHQLCNISELPTGPERVWLEDDITSLAAMFADLMSAQSVRLRLDVVKTNACRKFHIDVVTTRLVCTYRGTGTQYGNGAPRTELSRLYTVQTGAPILLRGTLHPQPTEAKLLHRSPPIEGSGEARLVLVLDPVADPATDRQT